MEPTITGAVIGGAAAIIAAIIGVLKFKKPHKAKSEGTVPGAAIAPRIGKNIQVSDERSHDKGRITEKVEVLKKKMYQKNFRPHLIIGIARMGLPPAAYLSKKFGNNDSIHVISLWPRPSFDNSLNNIVIDRKTFEVNVDETIRILIVDDICRSGETLEDARKYVSGLVEGKADIKTATITRYEGMYADQCKPDYEAEVTEQLVKDSEGEVDP